MCTALMKKIAFWLLDILSQQLEMFFTFYREVMEEDELWTFMNNWKQLAGLNN